MTIEDINNEKVINTFDEKWNVVELIEQEDPASEESFYLCNLSDVIKKYEMWVEKMPRVHPHYAVKCNDDNEVLKALAKIGADFDCASKGEIKKILSLGVSPERIIFANTTKFESHIKYAKEHNVHVLTFDNEDELYKIAKYYPNTDLVLRIRFNSEKAKYNLGKKFGCDPHNEALDLLHLTQSLNLKVIGISFHIGSSCEDYESYEGALRVSRKIFDIAAKMGIHFRILDIGGGFPGDNFEKINEFSGIINNVLDEEFPEKEFPDLQIYSEPGRYFVESAFTLVSKIHSRKITKDSDGEIIDVMYYLNEGVYSNFLFVPLGPEVVVPKLLPAKQSNIKYKSTLWGPTCDSTDIICLDIQLEKLEINDFIYFQSMGAYTIPLRTPFNGFEQTKVRYYIHRNDLQKIQQKNGKI